MPRARLLKLPSVAALLAALFSLACIGASASGKRANAQRLAQQLTAQQVVENLVARNTALTTFQAHVAIRLHSGIPFMNPAMEGVAYFKRPDRYEIVFTKAPNYAKPFQSLYSDIGDPTVWYKKFYFELAGTRAYRGRDDIVLRLTQRVRGQIDHEDVLVDPQRWVIDEMEYTYYSGGHITLEQTYRNEGGFVVLDGQHAVFAMPPFPRARADARYSDYKINVAIDDNVFTEDQTKHIGVK